MKKTPVLFNPNSADQKGYELAKRLDEILNKDSLEYVDTTEICNMRTFLQDRERIIICGGDGTVNRFVNRINPDVLDTAVYYYACGSGNDFLHDIGGSKDYPILINDYIRNLPEVTIDDRIQRFINGVGIGLDGYVCEEGNRIREIKGKKIDYTSVALKALLLNFNPINVTVTVDGEKHDYEKVWLAPTMNGRYLGGGMKITPEQRRLGDGNLSLLVFKDKGIIKTLKAFSKVFKGEHIKYDDVITILRGSQIEVKTEEKTPIQVDGEIFRDSNGYKVKSLRKNS